MDQLIKFVGSRLKELRKTQGWTQERLSQESGINPSYIADVERGERNITLKSFDRLINALGVTPFVFFAVREDEPSIAAHVNLLSTRSLSEVELINDISRSIFNLYDSREGN